MNEFQLSHLAPYPRFTAAARGVLATAAVAGYAFIAATAGPGNGWQPPRQAQYVTLPTVVVVGQRQAPQQAVVASAAVSTVGLREVRVH